MDDLTSEIVYSWYFLEVLFTLRTLILVVSYVTIAILIVFSFMEISLLIFL